MKHCLLLGLLCLALPPLGAAELTVHIRHIQHLQGQLLLAVHNSPDTWPHDSDTQATDFQALRSVVLPVQAKEQSYTFTDLPPGRYAVGVIHDENGDGRMNRHIYPLIGMPEEPYALSNDAWSWFSKAPFDAAAFELPPQGLTLSLPLRTHLQRWRGQDNEP